MTIEELVKKFVTLASKTTLSKAEHEEAQELMKQLKEAGMTNENISKLSKGKWTSSTIKFYTPGIKPTHPTPWDDVVAVLDTLIAVDFTLNDVETAVKVAEKLKSHSVSLDSIIGLLFAADSSSLEVPDLIHHYELFEEYGLSPKKISEALGLKEELEKMGLGLDSLIPIVELAKNCGEPGKVIEALSQYKSLIELDQHIAAANSKLNSLQEQLTSRQEQIKSAEANLSQLKDLIEAYDKVKQLGFDVKELTKLSALGQKHGTVKKLIDAVDAYDTYSDVQDKLNKTKSDLATLKSEMQKLQTDNAHVKTAITMCQTLIQKYTFGLDAIATILSVAIKYGEPLYVLKAIEAQGALEVLQKEKASLEAAISELKAKIAGLEGQYSESLGKLESLNKLALAVGNEVGKVQGRLEASNQVKKLMELIDSPGSAGYGEQLDTALLVAVSLRKWVSVNESKFKSIYNIKSGLESLIKELGGLP